MLLVPAPAQLVQPLVARLPRIVPRREPAAVGPGRAALDGHHPVGGLGQQLPVVRDVEHGLVDFAQPALQPPLGRYVEEVVRLVEQQHLVGAAQQQLKREPLLLPARECPHRTRPSWLPGQVERADAGGVEEHLGVVPAGLAPGRDRLGVAQLSLLGRASRTRPRASAACIARSAAASRTPAARTAGAASEGEAQDRRAERVPAIMPMNCRITPRPPARAIAPSVTGRSPATILKQRRLAGAVRPDQGHLGALADPEGHVGEEHPPVGEGVRSPATSTYPTGQGCSADDCPGHDAGICRRGVAHPQHPEPLLAGVPLDPPAPSREPGRQRVAAEVAGHHEPGRAVRLEPGQPAVQQRVQLGLADADRGV